MVVIERILDAEKYLRDVDGVVFDLDDTLYSELEYVKSGFKSIADYFGMPELEKELWGSFKNHNSPIDEVFANRDMQNYKSSALEIYRGHKPNISLYHGVREMLLRINNGGRMLGLITDGRPDGQRAKISALGIQNLFNVIIITDELGDITYRKPSSKAFIMMRDKMNIPFERMVYVGDNINKDFIAPNKLGMKQIYFNNPEKIHK